MARLDPMYWEAPDTSVMLWVAGEPVEMGWKIETGVRVPGDLQVTPVDIRALADQVAERLQQLAARRYRAMIRTPLGPGVWITSDDTAIARINAKVAAMERGGVPTIDWKLDSGAYVSLTLDQLKATGLAMDAHWTACWANEATLAGQIVAVPDAASLDAIDIDAGWPEG